VPGQQGRFHDAAPPRSRGELSPGVTPGRLRGPRWRKVSRDRYVPADADPAATSQRIVEAASRAPLTGAIGGWASAWAHGVDECDGRARDGRTPMDVPIVVPSREIRVLPGLHLWYDRLPPEEVVVIDGIAATTPARTCFDGMRRAGDIVEAVVFADRMLHAGLVTLPEVREFVDRHRGWRGVPLARRALDLADPMARNGWETRLRMVWVLDANLPRPLCNTPVFDLQGRLLGFPDLLDPDAGTVGEYDGKDHRELDRHSSDNVREELFEDHGLVVTRATSVDYRDRAGLAARMRRARARGLGRDRGRDQWTLQPPPDWGALCPESQLHTVLDELDAAWVPPW
jgi:hypothetical protein